MFVLGVGASHPNIDDESSLQPVRAAEALQALQALQTAVEAGESKESAPGANAESKHVPASEHSALGS